MTPTVQSLVFQGALGWCGLTGTERGLSATTFGHKSPQLAWRAVNSRWEGMVRGEELAGRVPHVADVAAEIGSGGSSPEPNTTGMYDLLSIAVRMYEFMSGARTEFRDIRLDLHHLTSFQRDVTEACCAIDWGQTRTYADLARHVGRPRAARAVGGVMRRNSLPLIVPCHRVVGAQGQLTGFSAPDGILMKARLLKMEQEATPVTDDERLLTLA